MPPCKSDFDRFLDLAKEGRECNIRAAVWARGAVNFHGRQNSEGAIRQNYLLFAKMIFPPGPLTEIFIAVYGLSTKFDRGDLRQIAPRKKSAKRPGGFKASR
jgi:hypothetical protein